MSKSASWILVALVALVGAGLAFGGGGWLWNKLLEMHGVRRVHGTVASQSDRTATIPTGEASEVTIPFDLASRHIVLGLSVNGSRPLSFVLDTGDKLAMMDLDRAHELGVKLGESIHVGGVGSQVSTGAFVKDAAFTIPGFAGFSQPMTLALPLKSMASRLGRDFDGIIGGDFIQEFVVEIDYPEKVIRLHDRRAFTYSGSGESVPMKLNSDGHPTIEAEMTSVGGEPIKGRFLVDVGASYGLTLYGPTVAERHLPGPGVRTVKALGGRGAGGKTSGLIGRISGLKIGGFTLSHPVTFFSEDKSGAFADPSLQGNIGQPILSRFKIFLDYSHDRLILEPNAAFDEAFDPAFCGLVLEAEGTDYRTFRITQIQQDSPATEAGLHEDDVITAVDDRPASESTLTQLLEKLQRPVPCRLTVRRGDRSLDVTLTPRSMV